MIIWTQPMTTNATIEKFANLLAFLDFDLRYSMKFNGQMIIPVHAVRDQSDWYNVEEEWMLTEHKETQYEEG